MPKCLHIVSRANLSPRPPKNVTAWIKHHHPIQIIDTSAIPDTYFTSLHTKGDQGGVWLCSNRRGKFTKLSPRLFGRDASFPWQQRFWIIQVFSESNNDPVGRISHWQVWNLEGVGVGRFCCPAFVPSKRECASYNHTINLQPSSQQWACQAG